MKGTIFMQKWVYSRISIMNNTYMIDKNGIVKLEAMKEGENKLKVLCNAGQEGWELVSEYDTEIKPFSSSHYILKRAINEKDGVAIMQKWEYMYVIRKKEEVWLVSMDSYKKLIVNTKDIERSEFIMILDDLGLEGWELIVTKENFLDSTSSYTFRRPVE
jgi:hypothetical protein